MRRYGLAMLLLLIFVSSFAQYYDNVMDLTGDQLKAGLRTLISTNTNTNYDAAKLQLFQNVDNYGGYVTCIYSGINYNISSSYNGSSDPNTEHTYAQSWFSSTSSTIKKADIHHLFTSTMQINSSRGNLPFETVANHSTANVYYATSPWQSFRGNNSFGIQVFEPADESKGNIARALLYFYVRYDDPLVQGGVDMLPRLIEWHEFDPVDNAEIARNQAVYTYQTNRNPFIDHPEFVQRIWGPTGVEDAANTPMLNLSLESPYPNPSFGTVRVAYSLKNPSSIKTSIYNIKGQLVKNLEQQSRTAGRHSITWNAEGVSSGIYLLKVETETETAVKRILINR